MSSDFKEYKLNLINGGGEDVSLFGAFPADSHLRFTLQMQTQEQPSEPQSIPALADDMKVCIFIHADEWDRSYNKTVMITLAEAKKAADGARIFFADIVLADILSEYGICGSGLFYYYYSVKTDAGEIFLGGERPTELEVIENHIGERQLLIYSPDYKTSQSFRGGVVYQIFVDRFAKSDKRGCTPKPDAVIDPDWENGIPQYGEYLGAEVENNVFFGGNLYGIIEKIDYIAAIGVSTIYLSPVFEAYSNHKYDTGDYLKVDSMFGGDSALRELCKVARSRGIDVILDGVFNHTGDDSVYFNRKNKYSSCGAYQSKESPYYSWYTFREFPDDYECWWGVKILPRIDSSNSSYRDFIKNIVIPKWMNYGVSGWRLDVADELSDEFLYDFRAAVRKNNQDGVIIGEVWEDASDKVSYGRRRNYLRGAQLDSVMNYPLRDAVISYVKYGDAGKLRRFTEGTYRRYPKESSDTLLNFLGTHDTERILTILGGDSSGGKTNAELSVMKMSEQQRETAVKYLKFAYALLVGLPGVPCVFYGDEAGLEGYRDPFCRRPFPWHSVNQDLLTHYQKIGMIRKDNAVFQDGLFRIIVLTEDVFAYIRYSAGQKILIIANRSSNRDFILPPNAKSVETNALCAGTHAIPEYTTEYFTIPVSTPITKESLGLK